MKLMVNTTFDRQETCWIKRRGLGTAITPAKPFTCWSSVGPDSATQGRRAGAVNHRLAHAEEGEKKKPKKTLKTKLLPGFGASVKSLHFNDWTSQAPQPNFYRYWSKGLVLKRSRSHFNLETWIRFPYYREHCPLICGFQPQLTDRSYHKRHLEKKKKK